MVFWSIVLGIIAVVLLLAWRSDRRRTKPGGRLRDIQVGVEINEGKTVGNIQRFQPPRP
jgi:hypothetical protein